MKRKTSRRAAEDAPYEIGYCKPPKHTRFKPDQSGYPSGRPRGRRNLRTAVRDALKEKITMREGDRTRNVSKMDAIIQVTLNKALKGDAKAFVAFIQLARWVGLMDEEPELSSTESIGADDEAILAGYLERLGAKPQKLDGKNRRPKRKSKSSSTRQQRRKGPEDKT
jgi:hypothetical protein